MSEFDIEYVTKKAVKWIAVADLLGWGGEPEWSWDRCSIGVTFLRKHPFSAISW